MDRTVHTQTALSYRSTLTRSVNFDDIGHLFLGLKRRWGHVPNSNSTFKRYHVLQMDHSMRGDGEIWIRLADQAFVAVGLLKTDQMEPE